MPELPEVESIARTLSFASCMQGPTLIDFKHSNYRLRFRYPTEEEIGCMLGMQLLHVYRRAKYLILIWGKRKGDKNQEYSMIIHLGMTGSLVFYDASQGSITELAFSMMKHGQSVEYMAKSGSYQNQKAILSHPHFCCKFSDDSSLIYCDPRRFGLVQLMESKNLPAWETDRQLGIEPLGQDFTGLYLHEKLKRHKNSVIKKSIMNQKIVVGIGNIYASEALFKAKISPTRVGYDITLAEAETLVGVSKEIMQLAIQKGGSTIRDYKNNDNRPGRFQESFAVYGRAGRICINCDSMISKCIIEGRATYWCESCQK